MQLEIFIFSFISLVSGCIPTYSPNFQEQEIFTTVASSSASPATSTVATTTVVPTSTTTSTVATTTTTNSCPCALPGQEPARFIRTLCSGAGAFLNPIYPTTISIKDCVLTLSGCTKGYGFFLSNQGGGSSGICTSRTIQATCDASKAVWQVPGSSGTFTYVSCV